MIRMNDRQDEDAVHARLTRLEEALGFASHDTDQLKEHFLALTRAVESLERRVRELERAREGPSIEEQQTGEGVAE